MASLNYSNVYASAGFSGETWDVSKGYNLLYTSQATDVTFAINKTITLAAGSFPAWMLVPGKVFMTNDASNLGPFTVQSSTTSVVTVYEAVTASAGVTATFSSNVDTAIQDVLLSAGNGALTQDTPMVLISTGALGAARELILDAMEVETSDRGSQALNGRFFTLSVQNSDISTNNLTVTGSASVNGNAGGLVIGSAGDYLFQHVSDGVWRANVLPNPAESHATISRVSFNAIDWDAGSDKNTIVIPASGSLGVGEAGPHGLSVFASYVVQVVNKDLTPDELVDVEIQFNANGSITLKKAAKAPDFNGVAIIISSLT
jgi:hypothetical protein